MRFGKTEIEILSDGTFTLEVGACFGVVPKKIWSRYAKESDSNRVRMALNVPLIISPQWSALIDSGVGSKPDERMSRIYEIDKEDDLVSRVSEKVGKNGIDYIVHSHLHFDHVGHSFELADGEATFPDAVRVAQKEEFNNFRNPNEVTRGSYVDSSTLDGGFSLHELNGSERIKDGLRVVRTGGAHLRPSGSNIRGGGKGADILR